MSRNRYSKKERDDAIRRADADFATHVLTQEGEGRWKFARPDSWAYGFRVIASPGAVIIHGDIGELIFCRGFDWLRESLSREVDVCYLAEKVSHDCKITEFQSDLVESFLNTVEAEAKEALLEGPDQGYQDDLNFVSYIRDRLEETIHSSESYYQVAYTEYPDYVMAYESRTYRPPWSDDPPAVEGLSWWFMFKVEALRRFMAALNTFPLASQ